MIVTVFILGQSYIIRLAIEYLSVAGYIKIVEFDASDGIQILFGKMESDPDIVHLVIFIRELISISIIVLIIVFIVIAVIV